MRFAENVRFLLENRYLLHNESPHHLFRRVARTINPNKLKQYEHLMTNLLFLPNSPTLMNAGTENGQLSACFVLPVPDSIEGIFTALTHMALIHKSGGGTGFSFSHIRPRGDAVQGNKGVASGPISFMKVFDHATDAVKQGGRRRGANMGILASSHPDIFDFIGSKREGGLENFNISIAFDDTFFLHLEREKKYQLINPRDGTTWKRESARQIWMALGDAAWRSGDPGVLFMDEINRGNTVPGLGELEATNPCGEQPLYPYESCNLGSINLSRCLKKDELDEALLTTTIRLSIEFLDNVIDVNKFPVGEIRERTLLTRKIGLGIMGLAETLILLGIPYESDEALTFANHVMGHIQREARAMSAELGERKGSFPAIEQSVFKGDMRNATVTTVAPTGSLHIIAGTSSGIEPLFSLAYSRTINGRRFQFINKRVLEKIEPYTGRKDLLRELERSGSVENLPIPNTVKNLYRTALEITPEFHVRMQATIQQHVDNAVSKTVNLPEKVSIEDILSLFKLARSLKCKGITVYRNNSKKDQVLSRGCEVCRVDS